MAGEAAGQRSEKESPGKYAKYSSAHAKFIAITPGWLECVFECERRFVCAGEIIAIIAVAPRCTLEQTCKLNLHIKIGARRANE